uniref:SS18, nBAF chromatin remodeling complex subunit like 2 n=1 Tax=Jaculus jaculus TaxID=51337 RepID=A0A8C5KKI1_JACJA|nr:SS18-like protein 2 isoform X1 [Jaculus jaculus]
MSVIFAPSWLRGTAKINQDIVQRLLEENDQLIRCIVEYQNKGRANECVQYQHVLHRNLIYLATIADSNTAISSKAPE